MVFNSSTYNYELEWNGYIPSDTFQFINNQQDTFLNIATKVEPISFPAASNLYISKTYGYTIGLGYSSINNAYTTTSLAFANTNFLAEYSNNGYVIKLTSSNLKDINEGYYLSTVVRTKSYNLGQVTSGGGRILTKYIGPYFGIQLGY
jgi:hypothetical protein